MEDEIVCPQARDVPLRVEAGQRFVEVVRQEDFFELASPQHLLFPIGLSHLFCGGVVQHFPICGSDAVILEAKENAAHLQQPTVLSRVFDVRQFRD